VGFPGWKGRESESIVPEAGKKGGGAFFKSLKVWRVRRLEQQNKRVGKSVRGQEVQVNQAIESGRKKPTGGYFSKRKKGP